MRRADDEKTQELVNIFEKAYNCTTIGKQIVHHQSRVDEIIDLIRPLVDVAYDEKKRKPELVGVACERFRQQNAISIQQKHTELAAYEAMSQRWSIRSHLHQHYRRTRTDMTLRQLHQTLSREYAGAEIMPLEHLKTILPRLGFRVSTTRNGTVLVLDNHKSRLNRIRYLRQMQEIRDQHRPIVYLCEASVNVTVGVEEDVTGATNAQPSNNLILLYAACRDGLINFTFAHKQSHEITADNFIDWLRAVTAHLNRGTVLVVESKSYTQADASDYQPPSRRELERWLKVNDVPFESDWTSIELRDAVRQTKSVDQEKRDKFLQGRKDSRLERAVKQMGHLLVHIPKYHPELRPFAAADFFATANVEATSMIGAGTWMAIAEMARNCIRQRLDESTAEQWALHCDRIVDVEADLLDFEEFVNVAESRGASDEASGSGQQDIAIVIDDSSDDDDL